MPNFPRLEGPNWNDGDDNGRRRRRRQRDIPTPRLLYELGALLRMSLELHVWGPAFSLASIDPECLAAIAYFSLALPLGGWTLVATSPSAVPHPLPALRDTRTQRWAAAGFDAIVDFLVQRAAETAAVVEEDTARDPASTDVSAILDLDAELTPVQRADSTAYAAYLRAEAAPLLALSLHVSSANWAETTRPAYSQILPFPLTWIEPPAVRAAQAASAAHLGFSRLDTDVEAGEEGGSSSSFSSALHAFPDRLRAATAAAPARQDDARSTAAASAAEKQSPTAAALLQAKKRGGGARTAGALTVTSALTPEAKVRIRLDETTRSCLAVLAKRKGPKRLFLRGDDNQQSEAPAEAAETADTTAAQDGLPTSLDCLAFGYLALMLVPDVPRPFLRESLLREFAGLAAFVHDMRQTCFGGDGQERRLPWKQAPRPFSGPFSLSASTPTPRPSPYLNPLWLRTVQGIVHSVPGLSGEWLVWLWRRVCVRDNDSDGDNDYDAVFAHLWNRDLAAASRRRLLTLCATASGLAVAAGLFMGYRSLPPFGAPLVVYRRAPRALVGLGAAGAFLGAL